MISPTAAATLAFDAQALFFLDRRLDAAPLDEILRLDDRQHVDRAIGLGRAAGGEAQRHARLRAVVDHDQISARHPCSPLARRLRQSAGASWQAYSGSST